MTGHKAWYVVPHCTNSNDAWYSPGRSAKVRQVLQILSGCGYSSMLLNTCPADNENQYEEEVQISNSKHSILRLLSFLTIRRKKLPVDVPSIIVIYNSRVPEVLLAWRLMEFFPKAALIVEIEDLPAARKANASWRGRLDWLATRWIVRHASLVICVSQAVAKKVVDFTSINAKRIEILPPLIDQGFLAAVDQRPKPPFSSRRVRVLYAGGYSLEKGVEDLLWAFSKLDPSRYRLHLAGPITYPINQLASKLPHVYVHGNVDTNKLYTLYQYADVVVNPHRAILHSDHVLPFKSIEQAASGALPFQSTELGTSEIGLPHACLFNGRFELLKTLKQSYDLWLVYGGNIRETAKSLRRRHSVSYFISAFKTWTQSIV